MSRVQRPEIVKDEHLDFLDDLRESGETNMYGAGAYLEAEFGFPKLVARTVLDYWMRSFSERHPR